MLNAHKNQSHYMCIITPVFIEEGVLINPSKYLLCVSDMLLLCPGYTSREVGGAIS
jgi:hypothetical protein